MICRKSGGGLEILGISTVCKTCFDPGRVQAEDNQVTGHGKGRVQKCGSQGGEGIKLNPVFFHDGGFRKHGCGFCKDLSDLIGVDDSG